MTSEPDNISFQQVVLVLQDAGQPFPPKYLHKFSDLTPEDIELLKQVWFDVPEDRRARLLEDLEDIAEADTLVSFDVLSRFVLHEDDSPRSNAAAIRLLWECEDPALIPKYLDKIGLENDEIVRANAATALGLFIYLGELDEIPKDLQHTIENNLLDLYDSNASRLVRRRALESLGFSPREEVIESINDAYQSVENEWKATSLFAMGRSADIRWKRAVLEMIDHPDHEVQSEAVRAAGQLELSDAREPILEILDDPFEIDMDLRFIAVWSLSQIGGEDVRDKLEEILDHTEDEEEILYVEKALENLEFTEEFPELSMFNFGVDEDDEDLEDLFGFIGKDEPESDED